MLTSKLHCILKLCGRQVVVSNPIAVFYFGSNQACGTGHVLGPIMTQWNANRQDAENQVRSQPLKLHFYKYNLAKCDMTLLWGSIAPHIAGAKTIESIESHPLHRCGAE
jgi:hypothetical protein